VSQVRYASMSFAGMFAIAVTTTLMGPSFPVIVKEFNLSLGLLGFLASAWSAGYLLSFIGGLLSDRYGEATIISLSFVIVGVAAGLISAAPSYDLLLVLFLLAGIGGAFGESAMTPLIARLFPKRGGFALNILHLFYSLGSFVGPIVAALVISWYGNWRLSYSMMAAVFGLLIVISILTARKSDGVRARMVEPGEGIAMREVVTRGWVLMLAMFFYLGAETGTSAWLPTFLVMMRGFSIELAGVSLGLFWGTMAVGRLVLGSVTDRVRFRRIILFSSIVSAVLIFLGIMIGSNSWMIISWSTSGFVMGPIMPTLFAWANRLFDSRRGFVTGLIYCVGFAGGVFSPWLLGTLADLLSLRFAMLYLVFSISAVGVSILMVHDSRLLRHDGC